MLTTQIFRSTKDFSENRLVLSPSGVPNSVVLRQIRDFRSMWISTTVMLYCQKSVSILSVIYIDTGSNVLSE